MRIIPLTLAALLSVSASAHAQNWMYQSGPNGTPPFAYGDPYGNLYRQQSTTSWPAPTYTGPQSFGYTPAVPGISRYSPGRIGD